MDSRNDISLFLALLHNVCAIVYYSASNQLCLCLRDTLCELLKNHMLQKRILYKTKAAKQRFDGFCKYLRHTTKRFV
ncbi:hypothetical protein BD560DRAFT_400476 [Blakeslea trispora]|nr:hypothetical protein BD560DRAFT_400476 [Blakeslea trispora]